MMYNCNGAFAARRAFSGVVFFVLTALLVAPVYAQNNTPSREDANIVCTNWLAEMTRRLGGWSGVQDPQLQEPEVIASGDTILGYLYKIEPGGSVIVPALFDLPAALVYSESSQFQLGEGVAAIARDLIADRLRMIAAQGGKQQSRHRASWESYLKDESVFEANLENEVVVPMQEGVELLDSFWTQNDPFNADCPFGSGGGRTLVGCVATAAAQIMNYHKWPPIGEGSNSYQWDGDDSWDGFDPVPQTLSASFSDGYGWEFMANEYLSADDGETAVAELCYEIGVAVEMDYGVWASGVATSDMIDVYRDHFRYSDTIDRADRMWHTAGGWFDMIKEDIDLGRPIHYRIKGHSIVVDGWRYEPASGDMQYHLNYGWGDTPETGWWNVDDIPGSSLDWISEYMIRRISPDVGSVAGLPAPALNTPQQGGVVPGTTVFFDWSTVDGASGYTIALGTSCDSGMAEYRTGTSEFTVSGLAPGETYYWRVKTMYGRNNSGPFGSCRSFTVESLPVVHTSISIPTLGANPSIIDPYGATVVSGTAIYEDGSPVAVGTATITVQGGSIYSAPIVNGAFSRTCQGPGNDSTSTISRSISVSASDGVATPGTRSITISVRGQTGTSYDLTTNVVYDYDGDDYGVTWYSKDAFRTTDEFVEVLALFENMTGSGALDLQWECYRPTGEQYGSTLNWDEALWLEWGWGWASWGWLVSGNSMAYNPGKYQIRFAVNDDRKATHDYVVAWDFIAHFLSKDYTEEYQPINTTNLFSPSDSRVVSLNHFEYRAQELNYKTEFVDPGGAIHSAPAGTYEDNLGPNDWWGWSRDASSLYINGTSAEYKCGDWAVKYYVQNPSSGSWELKYTEGFRLAESNPPSVSVEPVSEPVVSGLPAVLNISASDDNHLDRVVVHWNDGSDRQNEWTGVDSSSFSNSYSIGTYGAGQAISYWVEAWDESENHTVSVQQHFTVQQETVNPPTIPAGPQTLVAGESGTFATGGSVCNAGHAVEYQLHWGDGTSTAWGATTGVKSYTEGGTYPVTALARCVTSPAVVSAVSMPLLVSVEAKRTWFVSGAGSDSNSGDSDAPFATIQHGIDVAAPSDTVYVVDGTYHENIGLKEGVAVIGAGADRVTISGEALVTGVVNINGVRNASLHGFEITVDEPVSGYDRAVVVSGDVDNSTVVRECLVRNTQYGVYISGGSPIFENNTVVGEPDEQGFYVSGVGVMPVLRNNVITGYSVAGINVVLGADPILECNNLWDNGASYLGVSDQTGLNGNTERIPLFCDAASANYYLQDNSPLSEENSACGLIGAFEAGCSAPILLCRDIQVYDAVSGDCESPMIGVEVDVKGKVYVVPGEYSTEGFGYLQDDSGGIRIWSDTVPTGLTHGEYIVLSGVLEKGPSEQLQVADFVFEHWNQLTPEPVDYSIADLVSDYGNTASYVRVFGVVSDLTSESFNLNDGSASIEVRRNAFTGISFDSVIEGETWGVVSPCLKEGPVLSLSPANMLGLIPDPVSAAFVNVATGTLADAGMGQGVAWGDYDNDGDQDIFLARYTGQANRLFSNNGDGTFGSVYASPFNVVGSTRGVGWGDYDNDGMLDLYCTNFYEGNQLIHNDGFGVFSDATTTPLDNAGYGQGSAWLDYDNDGYLDIYFVNRLSPAVLLRNNGDGTFSDATTSPLSYRYGNGMITTDYDDDGDIDIYISGNGEPNKLFRNEGSGTFVDVSPAVFTDSGSELSAAWGDYDNDGDPDLYTCNMVSANQLFRNDGGGVFVDVTNGPLSNAGRNSSAAWADYDLDGDLDLYATAWSGSANRLMRNDDGVFVDVTSGDLGNMDSATGVAWGDYDGDGDPDIYLANFGQANCLLRNQQDTGNHWLQVKLVGTVSNRAAIGSRIWLYAGGKVQMRDVLGGTGWYSQDSLVKTFGLGAESFIDSLIIRWPSGSVQRMVPGPQIDRMETVFEVGDYDGPWYVANDGSNANPGTSSQPFLTIQRAVDVAGDGDEIVIASGQYGGAGNVNITWQDKGLTIRSATGDPDDCVISCMGEEGFVFANTAPYDLCTVFIEGLTVVGASTAIGVTGETTLVGRRPATNLHIADCRLRNGTTGIRAIDCYLEMSGTNLYGNGGTAIQGSGGGEPVGFTLSDCVVRANSTGVSFFKWDAYNWPTFDRCEFVENGIGLNFRSDMASVYFADCRIDSSNAGPGIRYATDMYAMTFERCSIVGNSENGIREYNNSSSLILRGCRVEGNERSGVSLFVDHSGVQLEASDLVSNGEWGITREGMYSAPADSGVSPSAGETALPTATVSISGCTIRNNMVGGINLTDGYSEVKVDSTSILCNGGPGVVFGYTHYAEELLFDRMTVAGNTGAGITLTHGDWSGNNLLIADNDGAALDLTVDASVSLGCTDIFGNLGGDWTGAIADQIHQNNNASIDPLFCDPATEDYHLSSDSACAADRGLTCGQIGALGTGCGSLLDTCVELQEYDPGTGLPATSREGERVSVEGVVYLPMGVVGAYSGGYLADENGGINFWCDPPNLEIHEGDVLQINGPLWISSGEIYVGTFSYVKIDSNRTPTPVVYAMSELLSDYNHVGQFVRTTGTITSIGSASLWLTDGADAIEVLLSSYAGVTSDGLSVGMTGTVQGPCTIINSVMNIKPRRPSDMEFAAAAGWANITAGDLVDPEIGIGVCWSDFDIDGDEDLFVVRSANTPRLYANDGAGGFSDVTPTCIGATEGPGASWGDFNADGLPDLFLGDFGAETKILQNTGGGAFDCISLGEIGNGASAPYPGLWVDYNLDGALDLAVANYGPSGLGRGLEIFDGAQGFQEATPPSLQISGAFQGMHWADMDLDNDLDVVLTTETGYAIAYENRGSMYQIHPVGTKDGCQGVDVGDFNNDGLPDVFITNWGQGDELLMNAGGWLFEDRSSTVVTPGTFGQSAVWGDYDNDGWLDLFVARYNADDALFVNNADQTFTLVTDPVFAEARASGGAAHADVDNDGDLDIYVSNEAGQDALLRNGWAPAGNNWVKFRLSDGDGRSNEMALGVRMVVYSGDLMMTRHISGGNGMNSQNSPVVHFGLGQAATVDSVYIYWPSLVQGTPVQRERFLSVNTTHDFDLTAPTTVPDPLPSQCALYAAVPNPFNPMTTISYHLPEATAVNLRIYDVSGKLVKTLTAGQTIEAGRHDVIWYGRNDAGRTVATGVYFYRLETGSFSDTKRMTLVK